MKEHYTQLIRIQQCLLGEVTHEVAVRRINNRYHVRVLVNGEVNQEAVCKKTAIGWTARSLLRWEDKCGNISQFASAARERMYLK